MKRRKVLQNNVSNLTIKSLSQTCYINHIERVKTIRFEISQMRDALLELEKISEEFKIKSEAKCLVTHELKNFEFLCVFLQLNAFNPITNRYMEVMAANNFVQVC